MRSGLKPTLSCISCYSEVWCTVQESCCMLSGLSDLVLGCGSSCWASAEPVFSVEQTDWLVPEFWVCWCSWSDRGGVFWWTLVSSVTLRTAAEWTARVSALYWGRGLLWTNAANAWKILALKGARFSTPCNYKFNKIQTWMNIWFWVYALVFTTKCFTKTTETLNTFV